MIPTQLCLSRLAPKHLQPLIACLFAVLAVACSTEEPDVVIYCALDQVHAEPLIRRFENETGLTVRAEFDVEANKTVGLVNRLRAEGGRPRCDVFWNNEIAHTVALAQEGLLQSYDSPSAAKIPDQFRDPQRRWTGFAARGRIFIVNTDLVEDPSQIKSMWDILDPKWAGKVGMARPLTGTTLTHATALFSTLGEEQAIKYLSEVREANREGRLALTSGNATLMRQVRDGQLAFGWTDTDDFNVALDAGSPVIAIYPDQDDLGTMVIPNTVSIIKGAPHLEMAKKLVDFILSPAVEEHLAASRSAQIPVRDFVPRPANVIGFDKIKVMAVDFDTVGREMSERHQAFKEMFLD
ncbi:MAG: iron(III) transport system substrate-binding protein [Planctomycetota bacterium]|jgi:iron(III) transport system substrate-binding protein